ncbi:MAG: cation diffusion facilitator family transporter, partial [Planctomycetes bacterium]|nr:cation diffusion facilitator family transporter [Planctomycetota bacterium]
MDETSDHLVARQAPSPRAVTCIALVVNAALSAAKMSIGILFASQTILADGLHSASDLVTDAAVLASLGAAAKPPDASHHYGHRRVATLTAMFVGAGLMGAAVLIVYRAITSLQEPSGPVRGYLPLAVAVASIPIKEGLYRIT